MSWRRIRLCDQRGREATVLLVPRQRPDAPVNVDATGEPVRFVRLIKSVATTSMDALQHRCGDPDALARALIAGDPELDLEATGRETGSCDRVWVDGAGQVLYAPRFVEVVQDARGNEVQRREPVETPANLVPEVPPVWSGKLIRRQEAARRYAFTRVYQVRHSNSLEYDFLHGLARHLEQRDVLALVGSGPKGVGPLILERNGKPMKGFLEGRTQGERYLLLLHLAAFELKPPEESP